MKKKLAILLAALLCLGMIACGGDKPSEPQTDQEPAQDTTPEGETAGEADTTEAETEPEEETVDTSVMTDYAWSLTEEGKTVALTFDGTNATLNILEGSEDKSVSGEWTATADTLTIDMPRTRRTCALPVTRARTLTTDGSCPARDEAGTGSPYSS